MKKLNSKGFTLVELLAVIIILAIVVGITIPAVLTTTNKAKIRAFDTAASTLADWFDRQYQVASTGLTDTGIATIDNYFKSFCGPDGSTCTSQISLTADIVTAGGLKPSNLDLSNNKSTVQITNGRACVKLNSANNNSGDYNQNKVTCGGVCTATQCTSTNN